jgi:hypothetical protein
MQPQNHQPPLHAGRPSNSYQQQQQQQPISPNDNNDDPGEQTYFLSINLDSREFGTAFIS